MVIFDTKIKQYTIFFLVYNYVRMAMVRLQQINFSLLSKLYVEYAFLVKMNQVRELKRCSLAKCAVKNTIEVA